MNWLWGSGAAGWCGCTIMRLPIINAYAFASEPTKRSCAAEEAAAATDVFVVTLIAGRPDDQNKRGWLSWAYDSKERRRGGGCLRGLPFFGSNLRLLRTSPHSNGHRMCIAHGLSARVSLQHAGSLVFTTRAGFSPLANPSCICEIPNALDDDAWRSQAGGII